MISNEWLAPRHVETPNIVADIAQFIYPGFTQVIFDGLELNERNKLTVVAERLEFIEHLAKVAALIAKHKSVTTDKKPPADGRIEVVVRYSIKIEGHEFAGFDFDSDALSIYLLLTCIDTIKGQPNYINVFDWLKNRCTNKLDTDWDMLSNEYEHKFGLSKRFKEAFTNDCSLALQNTISKNYAVVRIASQNIKNESALAWEKRSETDKVKCIASKLYAIRSRFTHASFRSFSPAVPVSSSLDKKEPVLLQRVGSPPLREVLKDVIKYLAKNFLIERNCG